MGTLAVLLKLKIFQVIGGIAAYPIYELTTPLFQKTILTLENGNTIVKKGSCPYIDQIYWNDDSVGVMDLRHNQLMKGRKLEIVSKN